MRAESTLALYLNPTLSLTASLGKQMEQMRQAQLNMVEQYNRTVSLAFSLPLLEMAKNMRRMQLNLAKSLQFALNPLTIQVQPVVDLQEAEIVEDEHSILGFLMSMGGMFTFEGQLVKSISTNSKQGRFLKMLLTYEDNYVSDKEAINKLGIPDVDRGIGYIHRDLKRDLLEAGIEIDLHRRTKKGYRLIGAIRLIN